MLTQKELKDLLHYDSISGIFIWTNSNRNGWNKKIAGYINGNGYRYIRIKGVLYRSGRLAFLYMEGYTPEHEVDHKDRNRSNDKWNNLRHVSAQCNRRNCGLRADNTSGIKGVRWRKAENKWVAVIKNNHKSKYIGYFVDFDEAVCHRLAAEQCLNWSDCDSSSTAFQYVKKMLSE